MHAPFVAALDALSQFQRGHAQEGASRSILPNPFQDASYPDPVAFIFHLDFARAATATRLCADLRLTADPEIAATLVQRAERFTGETNENGEFSALCKQLYRRFRRALCEEAGLDESDLCVTEVGREFLSQHECGSWASDRAMAPADLLYRLPAVLENLGHTSVMRLLGVYDTRHLRLELAEYLHWADAIHLRGCKFIVLCGELWNTATSDSRAVSAFVARYENSIPSLVDAAISAAEAVLRSVSVAKAQNDKTGSTLDADTATSVIESIRGVGASGPGSDVSNIPLRVTTTEDDSTKQFKPGHLALDQDPDINRFHHEPLKGNKAQIVKAMNAAGHSDYAHSEHLKILADLGRIKIQGGGKTWEVYVRNKKIFEDIKKELDRLKQPKT